MKRMALFMVCAVLSICAVNALAQGWAPGPMGAPPPFVSPMPPPQLGPQIGMGGSPLCSPQPMGPICKPPLGPASVSVMAGWQPNADPAFVKLSTRGASVLDEFGTSLKFNLEGAWLGVSARLPVRQGITLRAEARNLFSPKQNVQTITQLTGLPIGRTFSGYYAWRLIDGSASFEVAPCFSIIGGGRYDYFDVKMTDPGNIPGFSNNGDEADFTVGTVIPYLGFEAAFTGCNSGFLIRAVGTPWMSSYTRYGMTFGDPQGLLLIRDSLDGTSIYGNFFEASAHCGRKFGEITTLGAFVGMQALSSHSERPLSGSRVAPEPLTVAQTFDVDMHRRSFVVGGSASLSFSSPF